MSAARQKTLGASSKMTGTSLHTGAQVTLTMKPAPAGHGIRFRRVDLPDQPFINAHVSKVQTVERATTLAEGSVKVHTVEHVISALVGMGVDNAQIDMDANEPPIADGSSFPFVECIKRVGIVEQEEYRSVFEVREPIHMDNGRGSLITIVPDKGLRVSCTQVGPDGRMTQYFSTEITPEIYEKEIAPARTFVYYEEVEPLLQKGLIKGNSVMSKEALRFPDEFARHKILDILGDLMLCGKRINGHIIAVKPGHGPNTDMARIIDQKLQTTRAMIPPNIPYGESVLNTVEVQSILPHRYPFLMVDRIVGFDGDMGCTGVKQVTINEPYFQGHFPGHPVMPGVLQIEAMAQVGSIILLRMPEHRGKVGYFMSADKVKFRKPVMPGDTLFIESKLLKIRRSIASAECRCLVNGEVTSEAELKFAVIES